MPPQATPRELRSGFGKVWIACQRLPVKRVGPIIGACGQAALSLPKLILASQKKVVSFCIVRLAPRLGMGFAW